jgi:hypothetical protein
MQAKIVMKAPAGLGGMIQASASGRNYLIDEDGLVVVDAIDVQDLHGAGFISQNHHGDPSTAAALAPAAVTHRREVEQPGLQQSQDFGGARPLHGLAYDANEPWEDRRAEEDAALERQTMELSGMKAPVPAFQRDARADLAERTRRRLAGEGGEHDSDQEERERQYAAQSEHESEHDEPHHQPPDKPAPDADKF